MPSSGPVASPAEAVRRCRELLAQTHNEEQKSVFLAEVARIRFHCATAKLVKRSGMLMQHSRTIIERSRTLRSRADKLRAS
jgi:hypothetical protein